MDLLRKVFITTCIVAGFSSGAFPQTPLRFSLEEAKQHALEHNKILLNAGLAVDVAGERLRATIANGLPQVNATVDYSNFFGSTATLGEPPMAFEITFNPTSNLGVSVGQLIFNGSYFVGIQTARLYKEMSKTSFEKSNLDIKAQVTQAYMLCLISMKSKSVIEANLENIRSVLKQTQLMISVGVAVQLDYDKLLVQVGTLESAQRAANRQTELAMNLLRLQMGVPAEAEMELTDELDAIIASMNLRGGIEAPFALDENLDYQLMSFQASMAKKQVDLEKTAFLPSVTGFYSFTEKLLKPEFDMTPKHVIGLNVSIPIFSSGVRLSKLNQARLNLRMVENQKQLVTDQLAIQEKQLRFNLSNAIEHYESQFANVEVAKRVYQDVNGKYQQGMASSLDLTTANGNYLQAENGYISSLLQLVDTHVALKKLLNSF